jgi:hypothetical protein
MKPVVQYSCLTLLAGLLPLQGALVAHYSFDTNLDDSVGTQHLTAAGAAAAGVSGAILGGGALGGTTGPNNYLDGVTDQVATSANFSISGSQARTISAWFKTPADPGTPDDGPTIVGMGNSSTTGRRFDIRLSTSNGSLASTYDGFIRLEAQGASTTSTLDLGLDNEQWNHVFVSYTGSPTSLNGATVYINGSVVAMASNTTTISTAAAALVIGGSNHTADPERNFHGHIDYVGIWDTALAPVDAALIHGMARIGNNNLSFHDEAAALWGGLVGDTALINGATWKKVTGLSGASGDWSQVNGANGAGSFIVLDGSGGGLQIIPEPSGTILGLLGALAIPRRRRA